MSQASGSHQHKKCQIKFSRSKSNSMIEWEERRSHALASVLNYSAPGLFRQRLTSPFYHRLSFCPWGNHWWSHVPNFAIGTTVCFHTSNLCCQMHTLIYRKDLQLQWRRPPKEFQCIWYLDANSTIVMEVQLHRILKHLNWKEICWLLLKKETESKQ